MNENETVEQICREISCSHEGMIGIEFGCAAARILAAHKREIAEKDDERLTVVATYETIIAWKDAKIAKLRALVEETADNASLLKDEVCVGCHQKLSLCKEQKCSLVRSAEVLVAKARYGIGRVPGRRTEKGECHG